MRKRSAVKMPVPSEHDEQAQFVSMVEAAYPALSALLFAIPNGANKSPVARLRFKAEGLRPGVPDMFFAYPCGGRHGLFIEMKRRRGGVISAEQKAYIAELRAAGYIAEVCRGCDEAFAVFAAYLNGVAANRGKVDK